MEFEWDPTKEASNAQKHGIGFLRASTVFDDPHHTEEDSTKPEFGELRNLAVGMVDDRLIAVIYTYRGELCRIISARRARKDEQRRYDQGKTTP